MPTRSPSLQASILLLAWFLPACARPEESRGRVDLSTVPEPLRPSPTRFARYALHGAVLVNDGSGGLREEEVYLIIEGGRIAERSNEPPNESVPTLAVEGLILPGLIDLHEHLSYAYHPRFHDTIFAGPKRFFSNRYEWQVDPRYRTFSRSHYEMLEGEGVRDVFTAYGELRELVGGTTSVADAMRYSPPWRGTLARDVWSEELRPLSGGTVTYEVFFLEKEGVRADPPLFRIDPDFLTRVRGHDVVLLHLAEGRTTDERTRRELELFLEWARANPEFARKVILLHGIGIPASAFRELVDLGVDRLVWSPYSNLDLYGCTTDVGAALDAGFRVALGTDWYPTGTDSLFDELRVAHALLADRGAPLPESTWFDLLFANAPAMLGHPGGLGTLQPGAPADLIVLPRAGDGPFESLWNADVDTLQLTVVRGKPLYGRTEWMEFLLERSWPSPTGRRSFAFDVRSLVDWVAAKVQQASGGALEAVPVEVLGRPASVVFGGR